MPTVSQSTVSHSGVLRGDSMRRGRGRSINGVVAMVAGLVVVAALVGPCRAGLQRTCSSDTLAGRPRGICGPHLSNLLKTFCRSGYNKRTGPLSGTPCGLAQQTWRENRRRKQFAGQARATAAEQIISLYSPGGANVHPASMGAHKFAAQPVCSAFLHGLPLCPRWIYRNLLAVFALRAIMQSRWIN